MTKGHSLLIEDNCSFPSKPVKKEEFLLGTKKVCVGLFLDEKEKKKNKRELGFLKKVGAPATFYLYFKGISRIVVEEGKGLFLLVKSIEEGKYAIAVVEEKEFQSVVPTFFFGEVPQTVGLEELLTFTKSHKPKSPLPYLITALLVLTAGGFLGYQKFKESLKEKEKLKIPKPKPVSFSKKEAWIIEEALTKKLLKKVVKESKRHDGIYSRISGIRVSSKLSPSLVGYKINYDLEYLYPVVPSNFKVCQDLPCWTTKKTVFVKVKSDFKRTVAFKKVLAKNLKPTTLLCVRELGKYGVFPKKIDKEKIVFQVKGTPSLLNGLIDLYESGCRYYIKSLSCSGKNCSGTIIVRNEG